MNGNKTQDNHVIVTKVAELRVTMGPPVECDETWGGRLPYVD